MSTLQCWGRNKWELVAWHSQVSSGVSEQCFTPLLRNCWRDSVSVLHNGRPLIHTMYEHFSAFCFTSSLPANWTLISPQILLGESAMGKIHQMRNKIFRLLLPFHFETKPLTWMVIWECRDIIEDTEMGVVARDVKLLLVTPAWSIRLFAIESRHCFQSSFLLDAFWEVTVNNSVFRNLTPR